VVISFSSKAEIKSSWSLPPDPYSLYVMVLNSGTVLPVVTYCMQYEKRKVTHKGTRLLANPEFLHH
jgi:hypothetical protein